MRKRKLVDAATVAKRFGVSVATVNSWVRHGRIPYVRPSRRVVRFDLEEVERALRHGPRQRRRSREGAPDTRQAGES